MESKIAYFSAEFGLDANLPIYSGGLGVLAGDHVKAAHDLGIPLIGVGIFYKKGYFHQQLGPDGTQQAVYPELDPSQLPIKPVWDKSGQPLHVEIKIKERRVLLRAWEANAGKVPVYLLDADHEGNQEQDRRLTENLYGGDQETRIAQEMILGMGGVRLLRALRIKPDVWHMNEGHSAFSSLERIREWSAQGYSFSSALEAVRACTVFTTHTPVPAGHDQFSFELIDRYLGEYYWQLGASREQILDLGAINGRFNMTRLAQRTSSFVNGVSKLHAEVTKELFHRWMPAMPAQHIPVQAITNGIHTRTWLSDEMKQLYDRYLDDQWDKKVSDVKIWDSVEGIPAEELWQAHQRVKRQMIEYLGLPFSEGILTIGFARRFATYKRATILMEDMNRLEALLNQPERPVVILFAGKAHPADQPGQQLIRKIWEISQQPKMKGRIFLLPNYDMEMAKYLVSGVDVWLNTPIKPMEASGTSGQKAAVNGVLNCSILDGWWMEGYNGKNGWAIEGGGSDAEVLYDLLETEIIPDYYDHRGQWIDRMKESIRTLTPKFSTSCMVAEYWCKLYIPAALRGQHFSENGLEVAERVASYKQFIQANWEPVKVEGIDLIPTADQVLTIHCQVRLAAIWHKDAAVEAVGAENGGKLWKRELQWVKELEPGLHLFAGTYAGTREDWEKSQANIRVIPISPDFAHDMELELIKWGQPECG